ncbi:MAG: 16S rRNA (guanine(527)-N(7))-methyltransferase RsmG [Pseudomonadota bacterium]
MNRDDFNAASGLNVSRETFARLTDFVHDFRAWASRINLVAPSTEHEVWERHVVDSAQLLALGIEGDHWVDLGSGGGFPGVVLAICLGERDDSRVTLVESNRKKTSFLQLAKAKHAPNMQVLPQRIGDVVPNTPAPDVVTARALADLSSLIEMTHPWLSSGTRGCFLKGRGYEAEIEKSRPKWRFDLVSHPSRTAADAAILEISNLRPNEAI